MNKDRRTYAPQDTEDDCPKADRHERLLEAADHYRDEQKDREWEAAIDRAEARRNAAMKLTEKEMEQAKRAATRVWCKGSETGRHTLRPSLFPDMTLGYKCTHCDFQTKQKEETP